MGAEQSAEQEVAELKAAALKQQQQQQHQESISTSASRQPSHHQHQQQPHVLTPSSTSTSNSSTPSSTSSGSFPTPTQFLPSPFTSPQQGPAHQSRPLFPSNSSTTHIPISSNNLSHTQQPQLPQIQSQQHPPNPYQHPNHHLQPPTSQATSSSSSGRREPAPFPRSVIPPHIVRHRSTPNAIVENGSYAQHPQLQPPSLPSSSTSTAVSASSTTSMLFDPTNAVMPPIPVSRQRLRAHPSNEKADATVQYLQTLLKHAEATRDSTNYDVQVIRSQLNTIEEVTRKQKFENHLKMLQQQQQHLQREQLKEQQAAAAAAIAASQIQSQHLSKTTLDLPSTTQHHHHKKIRTTFEATPPIHQNLEPPPTVMMSAPNFSDQKSYLGASSQAFVSEPFELPLIDAAAPILDPFASSGDTTMYITQEEQFVPFNSPNNMGDQSNVSTPQQLLYGQQPNEFEIDDLAPWSPVQMYVDAQMTDDGQAQGNGLGGESNGMVDSTTETTLPTNGVISPLTTVSQATTQAVVPSPYHQDHNNHPHHPHPPPPHPTPYTTPATPSLTIQGPVIQSYESMSKIFLANYLSADVLSILEREYGNGNFCAAGIRQQLMWITASLEPEDQAELLSKFTGLNVQDCPHTCEVGNCMLTNTSSVENTPNIPPSTVVRTQALAQAVALDLDHRAVKQFGAPAPDPVLPAQSSHTHTPTLVPTLPHLTQTLKCLPQAQAIIRAFGHDMSPSTPAEDDMDGVARCRITVLFSVPPATAAVVHAARTKRKKLASTPSHSFQTPNIENATATANNGNNSDQVSYQLSSFVPLTPKQVSTSLNQQFFGQPNAPTIASPPVSANGASSSTTTTQFLSPTPPTPSAQHNGRSPDFQMHRMFQVNRAFEQLTGFTQADMVLSIRHVDLKMMFKHVRSDHLAACHRLTMKWRLNRQEEGHLYQVRYTKSGAEFYCLVHIRIHLDEGLFLGAVQSLLPLPADPDHPPPPFKEGVDLDEDTLLYGYKPPTTTRP